MAWKAVLAQNGWLLAEKSDYCMQIEVFKVHESNFGVRASTEMEVRCVGQSLLE